MGKLVICKTCGSDELTEVSDGLLRCKYCRHLTERPKENQDLMERAHNLRFNTKDFDEAAKVYEAVICLTPDESEAYWGKVLCRFGIEYVKDTNGEFLPTCHRTIKSSILEDSDYLMAVSKAKPELKEYYTNQAKLIDSYQTKIKVIAAKEEPYDVFISFKATDDLKNPTEDSSIAQEIYYYLTKNLGLKVFFSNITLKDKMGQEFEPIIYAALSSSTVMVLVGTKIEHINATWVKNEWSRYIAMMEDAKKSGKNKYIVPALKGLKPEQLPSALASYQVVDMGEIAAKDRLCSNIDYLVGQSRVGNKKETSVKIEANDMLSAEAANLCKLGFQSISLGETNKAGEYFQKALEKQADTSLAFWGKLLIKEQVASDDALAAKTIPLTEDSLYKMAIQCASEDEKQRYESVAKQCTQKYEEMTTRQKNVNEYYEIMDKLELNYMAKFVGSELSINETADKLFTNYFAAKKNYEEANEEYENILESTSNSSVFGKLFKGKKNALAVEEAGENYNNALRLQKKTFGELVLYTIQQTDEINNEYKAKCGNDIKEYISNTHIATHSLEVDDHQLKIILNGGRPVPDENGDYDEDDFDDYSEYLDAILGEGDYAEEDDECLDDDVDYTDEDDECLDDDVDYTDEGENLDELLNDTLSDFSNVFKK